MVQAPVKEEIGVKVLIDNLLSALYSVKSERWEDWDSMRNAVEQARDPRYKFHPVVDGLLSKIGHTYDEAMKRYADDSNFRREVDILREYKIHMKGLQLVLTGKNTNPSSSIAGAANFLTRQAGYLPREKRLQLGERLNVARSRFTYRR
ncbi:MAG: hypothetical protein HY361_04380 [Candidatus Aenigmarchaeota archaeon]|nr:hypothetical protein [Candidatus Aenigmarchaeota archaeon]